MKRNHRARELASFFVAAPFMLAGAIAYIATVGYKAGWAWAEYLGEKYL